MNRFISSWLLVCSISFLQAQTNDLASIQQQITGKISRVEDAKSNYAQRWAHEQAVPYKASLTQIETDKKKGKSETLEYRFNLSDLDPNLVRQETKKDLKMVTVGVSGRQKMVQVLKDGEQQNYTEEISILVTDSKEADELKDLIRSAIPLAKELDKQRLKVKTYEEMVDWLHKNVSDFTQGELSFRANLKQDENDPLIYHYTFVEPGRKEATTMDYLFNLSDLDPYTVSLNVKGKTVNVEVNVERKQRFITIRENGELKNYQSDLAFQVGEVDQGRDLAEVLRLIIPEADKKQEANEAIASLEDGLQAFQQQLTNFEHGGDKFDQSFEGTCYTNYRMKETNAKGDVTEDHYEVQLGDIAANNISIKTVGKTITVVGEVKDGDDFIKYFRNGEQKNYVDKVEFLANGVENAKSLAVLLKQIVEKCDQTRTLDLPTSDINSWLIEQTDGYKDPITPEYEQHLTIDQNVCSITFATVEPKGKNYEKMKYEVFLKELNPETLKPNVSGKSMAVKLGTVYNEKHIKSYKNEEVEKFTDSFEIRVDGIEAARSLAEGLKQLIAGCKE
ncbi:MAG: hypothetical protein DHS20C18_37810 [Saprospiraceae bacterium]|nr:MAG: hypothetical protein DHS20C18_37810 [Saprospiraceae bacterium]